MLKQNIKCIFRHHHLSKPLLINITLSLILFSFQYQRSSSFLRNLTNLPKKKKLKYGQYVDLVMPVLSSTDFLCCYRMSLNF